MSVWDIYTSRLNSAGATKREAQSKRTSRFLSSKLQDSLSYQTVYIDGVSQDVAIINTDNLNEKYIYSMPGADIAHGGLVEWMGNYWLVTERDAANELYTRGKLVQCNYLLRWIDEGAIIHEQWSIVEDGTKYLVGTYEDRDFFVTRGDSRLGLTLARNEHTAKLRRGCRFLIDDEESEVMLAYELTKPYKLSNVYNGSGVFKFVLQEVNTTDEDNQELRVADYYKYYPKEATTKPTPDNTINPEGTTTDDGRQVWL